MAITPLPAAPQSTDTPAEFNTKAFTWVNALSTFTTEANLTAEWMASLGSGSFNSTSTSSLTIGTDSKSLTVQTGKGYSIGQSVIVASTASPSNYMAGQVTSYNSGTGALVVNVTIAGGSGTLAAWTISVTSVVQNIPIASDLTLAKEATLTLASSIGSGVQGLAAVALDANRELLVMHGPSSVHAVVFDASTGSFGSPVLLRTASTAIAKAALVSADKVLVVTLPQSSTAMESVVLTTSGTTITVGTPVATTLATNSVAYEVYKLFALGAAWVFEYVNNSGAPCLRAITVSGTTPTVGAELAMSGFYSGPSWAVTSSVALCVRASNSQLFAVPVSLSGTTLTAGTQATATVTSYQGLIGGVLSSGRYAVAYTNSTVFGGIINVSGTTATISTVDLTLSAGTASERALHVVGAQAIVGATTGVNVLTDNAGTAVAGTALTSYEGLPFGRTASALLVNATINNGSYRAVGISGNNPALSHSHMATFDSTATVSAWPAWRQGNGALGHLTLRTSTGKHVALMASSTPPFALSMTSGQATVRAWGVPLGQQAFKSSSEAAVWGFALGVGNTLIVRKVEAA